MNKIANLLREVAANPKADAISYLKARMVEAADEIDRLSTPAAPESGKSSGCRMQGGICACHSGGSYGGCVRERESCCSAAPAAPVEPPRYNYGPDGKGPVTLLNPKSPRDFTPAAPVVAEGLILQASSGNNIWCDVDQALYDQCAALGREVRMLRAAHPVAPAVAAEGVSIIDIGHGETLRRELKMTGAVGWLRYSGDVLVHSLNGAEIRLVESALRAAHPVAGSPKTVSRDAAQLASMILTDPDGGTMAISSELKHEADGAMRFEVTNPQTGRRFGVYLGLAELRACSPAEACHCTNPIKQCNDERPGCKVAEHMRNETAAEPMPASEYDKAFSDAINNGTGMMMGGKHIPYEEFRAAPVPVSEAVKRQNFDISQVSSAAPVPASEAAKDVKRLVDSWVYAFNVPLSGSAYDSLREAIRTIAAPAAPTDAKHLAEVQERFSRGAASAFQEAQSVRDAAQPTIAVEEVRDAARYRWLRDKSAGQWSSPIVVEQMRVFERMQYIGPLTHDSLDSAIDAAIASTTTTKG